MASEGVRVTWSWPSIPFPLLAKELAEQAARRRTYIVRAIYAALLFGIFLIQTNRYFDDPALLAASLGRGREMFRTLVLIQFIGVLLFLPAMMSGVLTQEKERHSMALLLLTDMKPREILAQKYLSRLLPMVSFILLSLPLLAFCYAYGGFSTELLFSGVGALLLTCLQIGALAILCSAFATTSAGAFVATYVLTALLYLGLPLCLMWLLDLGRGPSDDIRLVFCHVPIYLFAYTEMRRYDPERLALALVVPQLVTLLFLGLARVFFIRRAFATPRNLAVAVLRGLDRLFDRVNDVPGGVRIGKRREGSLPGDRPVAWREVARRSLGRPVYLIRIAILLELPVILITVAALASHSPGEWVWVLTICLVINWCLAALAVAVLSANAIASERSNQTLELLLTTPLSGREIVRDKLRGMRRLILVLFIPFLSMFALKALWLDATGMTHFPYWLGPPDRGWPWTYVLYSTLAVVAYLPLVSWLSVFVALRVRTRFRAVVTILLVLVAWNALPLFLLELYPLLGREDYAAWVSLHWLAPSTTIQALEGGFTERLSNTVPILLWLSLALHAAAAVVLRRVCLAKADRYLGRARPRSPARGLNVAAD